MNGIESYGRTPSWQHTFGRRSGVGIEEVKWEILKQCVKYAPGGDKCDVCLSEKLCIMKNKDNRSLNKRGELMNTCRHRARWRLVKVKNK